MSIIKFCYVYIKFKRTNQSSAPSKISQSINVEWCTCDRNGKQLVIRNCKRTAKLPIFRSDFRKKGVWSKSVTKALYRNKLLLRECIFKLVCYCESCRSSDIGCA